MSDQLKVTSPPVMKEPIAKPNTVPNQIVDVSDTSKVIKTNIKDTMAQNKPEAGLEFNHQSMSARTLKLLTNADTITQIVKRLIFNNALLNPIANTADNQALINDFIANFFLDGEQILDCISTQCQKNTLFQGKFFDLLRNLYYANNNNTYLKNDILNLLKTFDLFATKEQTVNYLIHNLSNLSVFLSPKDGEKIKNFINQLVQSMHEPETQTMNLLDARKAIMATLSETASMNRDNNPLRNMIMLAVHNLSRLDNCDQKSLQNSLEKLISDLQQFNKLSSSNKDMLRQSLQEQILSLQQENNALSKQMISALDKGLALESPLTIQMASSNILSALLLNQSILLPLIYGFVPLQFEDTYLFSELWVNPDAEDEKKNTGGSDQKTVKVFFTLEASALGYFQGTINLNQKNMSIEIEAPELAMSFLEGLSQHLKPIVAANGFKLNQLNITPLKAPKKFYEVFGKDIIREAYINVRV